MGAYAIVINNMVENIIVLNANQIEEFENIYNAEIVDAIPYGLCIGDLKVGENWTRNINGIQTILSPLTPQQQTDYTDLRNQSEQLNSILTDGEATFLEGVESIG